MITDFHNYSLPSLVLIENNCVFGLEIGLLKILYVNIDDISI